MIYKKTFLPIKTIIQKTLQAPQYRQHWVKSQVSIAWNRLFPHLANEPQKLFIKGGVAYFQLSSLILANSLRQQKDLLVAKLQTETAKLGLPKSSVKEVVFL